ncbi:MAG: hypothetical protein LUC88_07345 [Prevotella sp.]|nr:hypothetical protein [Prevotella sp.]
MWNLYPYPEVHPTKLYGLNIIRIWKEEHPDTEINYVKSENVPQDVPQELDLDAWIERQEAIYPKISTEELAVQSGRTAKTIKGHITKMPHIKYIGSGYSGHWEVKEKEN